MLTVFRKIKNLSNCVLKGIISFIKQIEQLAYVFRGELHPPLHTYVNCGGVEKLKFINCNSLQNINEDGFEKN